MSATFTMTAAREAAVTSESRVKDVALFLAAPVVGLVYAAFFPLFALGAMAWIGCKALVESATLKAALRRAREALMIVSAPAVGLAFIAVAPVAGAVALVWFGLHGAAPAPAM
jgi:hypothetical protein